VAFGLELLGHLGSNEQHACKAPLSPWMGEKL
jgi:hypothetical protein